jgi:hypothetical protein
VKPSGGRRWPRQSLRSTPLRGRIFGTLLGAALGITALCHTAAAAGASSVPPSNVAEATTSASGGKRFEPSELESNDLFGSDATAPKGPTPRTSDGHPDLSGVWKGTRATKPVGNIGKDLPGFELPLTPAGKAALQYNLTKTVDPESRCIIGGIPRHSASALPFQIVQGRDQVVFMYMYTYFRSIRFNVHQHTEDPDPTFFGDKIGWWEGDTLVIDSIGFKSSNMWIDENGNPQSDAMHAVERWTRPDAGHIHLELTVDDPKYYTHPFRYSRTWVLGRPGEELREYSCSENNVDLAHLGPGPGPVRRDGTRGYDVPPLPAVPPPPPDTYDAH